MGYDREELAGAVAAARSWNDVIRRLGVRVSGGRRRSLRAAVAAHGIDTGHFARRASGVTHSDEDLARAVAGARTLQEVALRLGTTPATGTLSHLSRRIASAGIDVAHFPGMRRAGSGLPYSDEELRDAAARSASVREMARRLGAGEDRTTRAALRRALGERDIAVTHFAHSRIALPEAEFTRAVGASTSFADVMRHLNLPVTEVNRRRVRRRAAELGLDTGHFVRKHLAVPVPRPRRAASPLTVAPPGSARVNRDRLHRALAASGIPARCADCGNGGVWRGAPLTLHIDHVNGDRLDNRRENLRYLCPNCHAQTPTYGRGGKRGSHWHPAAPERYRCP